MHELILLHLAHLRAQGLSPRTIADAGGALDRADRALRLGITQTHRAELELYLGNEDWSQNSRQTYHNHLRRFYEWAADDDDPLISDNPMARMKRVVVRKGAPRPLSPEQIEAVLTRSVNPFRLCAVIALCSGLRCCEIAGLRKEDVGQEEIYIRRQKGGGSAAVPTSREILEAVDGFPPGLLVESAGGVADARWISIRSAVYFSRSLKLPGVSLHRMRHTFAKRLRDAGADAFVIRDNLRHKSLTSTEIYVGASEEECRQAVRGLPALPFLAPASS